MNSSLKKVEIIISYSLLIVAMLAGNYNQVYGGAGLEKLEFEFRSEQLDGVFLTPGLRCPDNHEVQVYGSLILTEGILYGPGWAVPQHVRTFYLSDNINNHMYVDIENWRISGVPPNQEFIVEGVEIQDILCNSDVPTEITIRGSCNPHSVATFTSKNGQRGEFKIMPFIGGGTDTKDHEVPICFVCGPNQHGWADLSGWSCEDDDKAAMDVDQTESNESGADPRDVHSSIGQVEGDDRPQPQADDDQQAGSNDNASQSSQIGQEQTNHANSSKNTEDADISNDELSKNTK